MFEIKADNQIYTITKKRLNKKYISEDVFKIKIKGKNFKKNFYYIDEIYWNGLYDTSVTRFFKSLKDVKKFYDLDTGKNKLFKNLHKLTNTGIKKEKESCKLQIKKILEEKYETKINN